MDLPGLLRNTKKDAVELNISLRVSKRSQCTPGRAIAFRVPKPVAELRRQRLRRTGQKKGTKFSDTTWQL